VVRIDRKATSATQAHVLNHLRDSGVAATLHYLPVHTQPYYRGLGFREGDFPEAELYAGEALTLPLYYGLSEADQDKVVAELGRAFGA